MTDDLEVILDRFANLLNDVRGSKYDPRPSASEHRAAQIDQAIANFARALDDHTERLDIHADQISELMAGKLDKQPAAWPEQPPEPPAGGPISLADANDLLLAGFARSRGSALKALAGWTDPARWDLACEDSAGTARFHTALTHLHELASRAARDEQIPLPDGEPQ